jgi:hypothetical protein
MRLCQRKTNNEWSWASLSFDTSYMSPPAIRADEFPKALLSQRTFATSLVRNRIRPTKSLKPHCAGDLQTKASRLTPFDPRQFVLSSPTCRQNIAEYGRSFGYFGAKDREVFLQLRLAGGAIEIRTLSTCPMTSFLH